MKIKQFFDEEYILYANYDNYQSIANYLDGMKPTARKLFYTYYTLGQKGKIKVAQLAAKMSEKCFTGDVKVLTDKGNIPIKEIVESKENYKVLSYNEKTKKYEWKKIIDKALVQFTDEIIEIEIDGKIIKCTPDHKFLVKRDGVWKWIEAENLKETDELFNRKNQR